MADMVKARPIPFRAPMVRALLNGSKTQTRRVIKATKRHPIGFVGGSGDFDDPSCWGYQCENGFVVLRSDGEPDTHQLPCPYGRSGDRLWVRETWADLEALSDGNFQRQAIYRADDIEQYGNEDEYVDVTAPDMRWRPSRFMPRWASRILLEVVSVRVERLQAIREADARAEGVMIEDRHMSGYCAGEFLPPTIRAYRDLWEEINGAGSWAANPWVWVVEFRRIAHE